MSRGSRRGSGERGKSTNPEDLAVVSSTWRDGLTIYNYKEENEKKKKRKNQTDYASFCHELQKSQSPEQQVGTSVLFCLIPSILFHLVAEFEICLQSESFLAAGIPLCAAVLEPDREQQTKLSS